MAPDLTPEYSLSPPDHDEVDQHSHYRCNNHRTSGRTPGASIRDRISEGRADRMNEEGQRRLHLAHQGVERGYGDVVLGRNPNVGGAGRL